MKDLSKEIDNLLDEFTDKNNPEDKRLSLLTKEEFENSLIESEKALIKEFEELDEYKYRTYLQLTRKVDIML